MNTKTKSSPFAPPHMRFCSLRLTIMPLSYLMPCPRSSSRLPACRISMREPSPHSISHLLRQIVAAHPQSSLVQFYYRLFDVFPPGVQLHNLHLFLTFVFFRFSKDLNIESKPVHSRTPYWLQTCAIAVLAIVLFLLNHTNAVGEQQKKA